MEAVLKIALTIILLLIAYQDFKYRAVLWILFPLAILVQFFISINNEGLMVVISNLLINLLIVAFQLGVLFLYFYLKTQKRNIKILKQYIGLGDILFFMVLAVAFSIYNFVLVVVVMLIASLLVYKLFLNKKASIPLAGLMAIFYVPLLALQFVEVQFNPYVDVLNCYL